MTKKGRGRDVRLAIGLNHADVRKLIEGEIAAIDLRERLGVRVITLRATIEDPGDTRDATVLVYVAKTDRDLATIFADAVPEGEERDKFLASLGSTDGDGELDIQVGDDEMPEAS
jgi:hypothetical protein